MNIVIRSFFSLFFLVGWAAPLLAVTWYSQGSGIWGDGGTSQLWNTAANGSGTFFDGTDVPGLADDIVIQATHQIEIVNFTAAGNFLTIHTLSLEPDALLMGSVVGFTIGIDGNTVTVDGTIDYPTLTLVSTISGNFTTITGAGRAELETISFKHSLLLNSVSVDVDMLLHADFYPFEVVGSSFTGNFTVEPAVTLAIDGSLYLDSDARTNFVTNQYDLASLLLVRGKLQLSGNLQIGSNNNFFFDLELQVEPGGTLQLGNGAIVGGNGLGGFNNTEVEVKGTLATGAADPFKDLNSRFTVTMSPNSLCRFEGDSNQLLDADVKNAVYYDVELAGNGPKLLSGPLEIQHQITLGTILQLGNFDLYLSQQLSGGFLFATSTPSPNFSFIDTNGSGKVTAWIGGGNIDFRLGNGTYGNIHSTNLSTSPRGYMRMWVKSGVNPTGPGTATDYVDKTWHLEKVNPTTNFSFNLQLYWTLADEQSNFNRSACWVARHDGANWDMETPLPANALASSRFNVTEFGAFAVASAGLLPVELLDVRVDATPAGNLLQWRTATEQHNSHFEVEYSSNGTDFITLGQVAGQGNSRHENAYSWLHVTPQVAPDHYYRLKQVDFDGQFAYSKLVNLHTDVPLKTAFRLYPNPATDHLWVEIPYGSRAFSQLQIFSMDGRRVWQQAVSPGDRIELALDKWPAGTYLIYGRNTRGDARLLARFVRE